MPWKLLDVKYAPSYKDPNFLIDNAPLIKSTIEAIKKIKAADPEKQNDLIDELYPSKKGKKEEEEESTLDESDDPKTPIPALSGDDFADS